MATFIMTAKLTVKALTGMVSKPEDRQGAVAQLVEAAGGKLLQFYFTTGEQDLLMVIEADSADVPTKVAMVAGMAETGRDFRTVQAWSPAELSVVAKAAGEISQAYRVPGR